MKLTIQDLKTSREWQSTIGLLSKKFYNLLETFELCYKKQHSVSLTETLANLGIENPVLATQ